MKNATLLFCAVCIIAAGSCKKENQINKDQSLIGKWRVNAYYLSDGGPGYWTNAEENQYVEFYNNGTLGGNAFTGYLTFAIKDNVTLFMKKNNDTTKYNYSYRIKHDTLTMSPTGPIICIEGCAVRFIKE